MPGSSGKKALAAVLLLLVGVAGALAYAAGELDLGLALVLAVQLLTLAALGVVHAHARHVERVVLRVERRARKDAADARRQAGAQAEEVRTAAGTAVEQQLDRAAGLVLTAVGEERAERVLRHDELQQHLADVRTAVTSSAGQLAAATSRQAEAVREDVRRVGEQAAAARRAVDDARRAGDQARRGDDQARRVEFRQLESLLDLHATLRPRAPVPASRGWAASPDILSTLVRQVLELRPQLVVDCGSGLSTLWTAYALERLGAGGRVVALEHDEHYARETTALLGSHDLQATAEVRHAPLTGVDAGQGEQWLWYDPASFEDLQGIGLVFVDGPPEAVQELSRYPAVPLLLGRCTPDVRLLLDDAGRDGERRTVQRWTSEHGLVAQELRDHEKGCCLLSRGT